MAGVYLMALLGGVLSEAKSKEVDLPNIIFILADDLGYMDLGCHGSNYFETPNIDSFSNGAMEFQAYYTAPVCKPTRAALMTGKSPARLHITCVGRVPGPPLAKTFPKTEYSLPKILKSAGYQTAVFGKWGIPRPVDSGFDIEKTGAGVVQSHFAPWYTDGRKSTLPDAEKEEYLADVLTSAACDFMESKKDEPFFMFVSYYAVHTPLQAPEVLRKKYESKSSGSNLNPLYGAMVDNLDTNFGVLLAKIKQLELSEKTIIIFTSDNGGLEHFWGVDVTSNAPLRGEKGMLYEGGIRVPFFIRWPGVTKPGSKSETPISIEDILPTLSEIANSTIPASVKKDLDGKSMVPLLKGEQLEHRADLFWHYPQYHDRFAARPASAIRSGDWKLIDFITEEKLELYHLKEDVGENNDLAQKYPEKAKELYQKLQAWREKVGADPPPGPDEVLRQWMKDEQGVYRKKRS